MPFNYRCGGRWVVLPLLAGLTVPPLLPGGALLAGFCGGGAGFLSFPMG